MFSQMMEVSIDTICLPWVTPGRKVYIKGTGFNDGNYSCLEVTHTIDSSNKFMSNIRGVRIIPPGDKELEKSLSSPELFDSSLSTTASRLSTTGNGTPLLNNQTTGNYMDRFKLNLPFENKLLKPATGRISSKFGYRNHPIYGTRKLHKGVDIACSVGTNVIAPTNGIITLAQFSQTAGNWMHLQHDDGQKSVFMHLSQFNKKVGDRVNKGELIALTGNTGASKGPHLHYEIYDNGGNPNDPEPFWT
jgi:murein DD-endopeptidase MepM/ murein hydrolase activator NlpD